MSSVNLLSVPIMMSELLLRIKCSKLATLFLMLLQLITEIDNLFSTGEARALHLGSRLATIGCFAVLIRFTFFSCYSETLILGASP